MKELKAWVIPMGEELPQWLEATENCRLFAGVPLLITESDDPRFAFQIRPYEAGILPGQCLIYGLLEDPTKPVTINGSDGKGVHTFCEGAKAGPFRITANAFLISYRPLEGSPVAEPAPEEGVPDIITSFVKGTN